MRYPRDGANPSSRSASSTGCTAGISTSSPARRSLAGSGACRSWRSPSTRIPMRWSGRAATRRSSARLRRRAELLAGLGVDAVCVVPFTLEFSRVDPDEFVRTVLVEKLHASAVVVGEDFRFGHKAAGDVPLLERLGEKYDYTAEGLPLLVLGDTTISSTAIRSQLTAGDVAEAARLLGRPHRVEGVVVRGHQRGRQLGFPTANVESPPHTAIPADGIYAGWLATLDEAGAGRAAGPPRSRLAPTRRSTARSARSRRTRSTGPTWTCTACTPRSTSPSGCAAPSASSPSTPSSTRCASTSTRPAPCWQRNSRHCATLCQLAMHFRR